MLNKKEVDYRLCLVTDRLILKGRDLCESVEAACQGGVTMVQLREKDASSREFYEIAIRVKAITEKYGLPLIINDRLDVAMAVDADGLHVGQEDLPMDVARRLLGPEKIIGVSTATIEEAQLAEKQGADYIGVGAMFATPSKNEVRYVSLEGLGQIKKAVSIPVMAIGGIGESNLQGVIVAGADGVAVISAILGQENIEEASARLFQLGWGRQK